MNEIDKVFAITCSIIGAWVFGRLMGMFFTDNDDGCQ